MSALEMCWQSEVRHSYCEIRVVIAGFAADVDAGVAATVAATVTFSSPCLRDCSRVSGLVAIFTSSSLRLDVVASKWVDADYPYIYGASALIRQKAE